MNVTVVGAGIVGLSIAHELASRGAAVRIVDPRGPGEGATRASAGMLAPYIEGHSEALLTLGVCSLAQYDRFVARVVADAGAPVEFRRTGTLQVATDPAGAEALAAAARRLAAASIDHDLLIADEARRVEPLLSGLVAGLHIPQHGYVAVRSLVSALARALAHRGITVAAERVDDVEAECRRSDAVILAAGSWAGAPVRPVRGQILHLTLPQPPLSHVVWGDRCYLVPWQDGSVLVGATSEDVGFDERATASGVRALLERGTALLPVLTDAAFEQVRVGLRPATPDDLPVIGASSRMPGVFHAAGHYRNGVLLAPWTAVAVADLVLERRERAELALVRPARFGL